MEPDNQEAPKNPEEVSVAKIEIELFADNHISLNGPINDRIVFYGMLQMAHDAVFEAHLSKPKLVKGNGGLINYLRNGKH